MPHRRLSVWPRPPRLTRLQALMVAAVTLAVAAAVHVPLDRLLAGRFLFMAFFPALALASYIAGAEAGYVVLAGALAIVWRTWPKADPYVTLAGSAAFVLSGTIVIILVAALREALARLVEQDELLRTINQELMHRNRNLFAIVTSLAANSMRRAGIAPEEAAALTERIAALARAQELIAVDRARGISLGRLVRQVLAPLVPEPRRLVVEGERTGIPGSQVTGLALVLHELGTNALKYGAWSNATGSVTLSWRRTPASITIRWREVGGPPPPAHHSNGLGSELIERAIAGADVTRNFGPAGVEITLTAPIDSEDDVETTGRPASA